VTQKKGVLSPKPTEVGTGRIHSRRPRGLRAARRKATVELSLEVGTTMLVWSIVRGIVVVVEGGREEYGVEGEEDVCYCEKSMVVMYFPRFCFPGAGSCKAMV
jgi:hypothetical protein